MAQKGMLILAWVAIERFALQVKEARLLVIY